MSLAVTMHHIVPKAQCLHLIPHEAVAHSQRCQKVLDYPQCRHSQLFHCPSLSFQRGRILQRAAYRREKKREHVERNLKEQGYKDTKKRERRAYSRRENKKENTIAKKIERKQDATETLRGSTNVFRMLAGIG